MPSLLPAFEPFSSSPSFPRSKKRPHHASPVKQFGYGEEKKRLSPPIPTSSTFIPTSSPPQLPNTRRRPPLQRTQSAMSERAPLSTVPSIELSELGEPTLMGRSSNSSHYQLSTNKLISRVHVRATYIAPTVPGETRKVQIECTGWNGVKVHCQGRAWELMKGDTFTSETEGVDIMLDVQDARVLITWPQVMGSGKALTPTDSDRSSWEGENSPSRRPAAVSGGGQSRMPHYTSPLRHQRLRSPVSPSPAVQATQVVDPASRHDRVPHSLPAPVQVYEDEPSDEEKEKETQPTQQTQCSTQIVSQIFHKNSQDTPASQDYSDNDEENDPIITSFGPFGANLDARFESFRTYSPTTAGVGSSPHHVRRRRALQQLKEESISPQRRSVSEPSPKRRRLPGHHDVADAVLSSPKGSGGAANDNRVDALKNHIINQLAYSALSATPLSTLIDSIPALLLSSALNTSRSTDNINGSRAAASISACSSPSGPPQSSHAKLESLLHQIPCIGSVEREGKDAAGKRLESEFYYILERDEDEKRREVVMGMGGRGLRNCRKSHKV